MRLAKIASIKVTLSVSQGIPSFPRSHLRV
jgi:hypothetical protein